MPNGPAQVASLPRDEQFSRAYFVDFIKTKAELLLKCKYIDMTSGKWKRLDELKAIYKNSLGEPEVGSYYSWICTYKNVNKNLNTSATTCKKSNRDETKVMENRSIFTGPETLRQRYLLWTHATARAERDVNFPVLRNTWQVRELTGTLLSYFATHFCWRFPITDEIAAPHLQGMSLAEALEQKRLFIVDLKELEGIWHRDDAQVR